MTQYKPQFNLKEKGQSLVEVALFLPIFLVIIAGLVEVSNILVTQNSVHNAARVGACLHSQPRSRARRAGSAPESGTTTERAASAAASLGWAFA